MALIESSGDDRRKFNHRSNQAKWIDKISAWAEEETNSYQLPESLEKFSQSFLRKIARRPGENRRDIPCLEAIESTACKNHRCRSAIW
ncbi:hypothetical protein MJK71_23075 [Escherichia coli]|nr:hypothetical protein MJK71_23075 [Escherichia coli]